MISIILWKFFEVFLRKFLSSFTKPLLDYKRNKGINNQDMQTGKSIVTNHTELSVNYNKQKRLHKPN